MKTEHYQMYLKARYAHYWHTPACNAWRQVRYELAQQTRRRLSPTYASVEAMVNVNTGKATYTINGILFFLTINEHPNEYVFEGVGEVVSGRNKPNYKHGHDRNDAYWVLDFHHRDPVVLVPDYTWVKRYQETKTKWGKAYAARYATEGRNRDIKWAEDTYRDGEYELCVRIVFLEDEDDLEEEWFSSDELTSIYDWIASKLDWKTNEQRRQAA